MNITTLHESLIKHEGLELKPYKCTAGKLTIGVGHNLDNGISKAQAFAILDYDIQDCVKELDRAYPSWKTHDDAWQNVLVEMVFNLGMPRFLTFRKMLAALEARDYVSASAEMLDSKWHTQVGQRAQTLATIMRDGF